MIKYRRQTSKRHKETQKRCKMNKAETKQTNKTQIDNKRHKMLKK